MYAPINGFTKARILKTIKKEFKGRSAVGYFCKYRGPDGKKCAVGIFIPDSLYKEDMEDLSVEAVLIDNADLCDYLPLTSDALMHLQKQHDDATEKTCLKDMLDWVNRNVKTRTKKGG